MTSLALWSLLACAPDGGSPADAETVHDTDVGTNTDDGTTGTNTGPGTDTDDGTTEEGGVEFTLDDGTTATVYVDLAHADDGDELTLSFLGVSAMCDGPDVDLAVDTMGVPEEVTVRIYDGQSLSDPMQLTLGPRLAFRQASARTPIEDCENATFVWEATAAGRDGACVVSGADVTGALDELHDGCVSL